MSGFPFSPMHVELFGDPATAALLSDREAAAAMVAFERALARVQARLGVIPAEAGAAIDRELAAVVVDPESLAAGTAADGVPVPGLLRILRGHLPAEAASWLHWGATSQDVTDTALSVRLGAFLDMVAPRLDGLIATLAAGAERHARTPMAGRTRSQIAAPTSFGLRIARWLQPLVDLRADLDGVRRRTARVQFGGAVGANTAASPHGPAIAVALAEELGLTAGPCWHTDRAPLIACACWCARLTGACGKMAADLVLMSRTEIGEVRAGVGGGSSTLPQKANPVAAETVVALAQYVAALMAPMHVAAVHTEERDGVAWTLEWLTLPQVVGAAGGCLGHSERLAATLVPDPARMLANLSLQGGAAMAERASYLLAASMSRTDAQALVKRAITSGEPLAAALDRLAPGERSWAERLAPDLVSADAAAAVEEVLSSIRSTGAE